MTSGAFTKESRRRLPEAFELQNDLCAMAVTPDERPMIRAVVVYDSADASRMRYQCM